MILVTSIQQINNRHDITFKERAVSLGKDESPVEDVEYH